MALVTDPLAWAIRGSNAAPLPAASAARTARLFNVNLSISHCPLKKQGR
jgi:hypothetical protein